MTQYDETTTQQLKQTPYALSGVRERSQALAVPTREEAAAYAWQLIEQGEYYALCIWICLCLEWELYLPPALLVEAKDCLRGRLEMPIITCFALLTKEDVDEMTRILRDPRYSVYSKSYLALAYILLALEHDLDLSPALYPWWIACQAWDEGKLIAYLNRKIFSDVLSIHMDRQSANAGEDAQEMTDELIKMLRVILPPKLDKMLPEMHAPRVLARGDQAAHFDEKTGRNDPCPCGSGKKYKKCCMTQREASADYSLNEKSLVQYDKDGTYMHVVVLPQSVLRSIEFDRIKAMDVEYVICHLCKIQEHEKAFELCCYCREKMPFYADDDEGANLFMMIQKLSVLFADFDVFDRAVAAAEKYGINLPPFAPDLMPLLRESAGLEQLDHWCRRYLAYESPEICGQRVEDENDPYTILLQFFFLISERMPGLAVLLLRAHISCMPSDATRPVCLDMLEDLRARLLFSPTEDPAVLRFDEGEYWGDVEDEGEDEGELHGELQSLQQEKESISMELRARNKSILDMENRLREQQRQLEKLQKARDEQLQNDKAESAPDADRIIAEQQEEMARLRRKLGNLKVEIQNQHDLRRQIEHETEKQRRMNELDARKNQPKRAVEGKGRDEEDGDEAVEAPADFRPVIPEYSDEFRAQCAALPARLGGKALEAIHAVCMNRKMIFKHLKKIQQSGRTFYRIRIGIHYRLIIEWEAGDYLIARALIKREDFDSWVQKHR